MHTQSIIRQTLKTLPIVLAFWAALLTGCEDKYQKVARVTTAANPVIARLEVPEEKYGPHNRLIETGLSQQTFKASSLSAYEGDPQWTQSYHLGIGDVLTVRVPQLVDLNRDADLEVTVDSQGRISLPVVGYLGAEGLTVDQLREAIIQRLQHNYMREPQVSVQIRRYVSKQVLVYGAVRKPGITSLERDAMPLRDVLSLAGGLHTNHGNRLEIIRGANQLLRQQAGGQLTQKTLETAKRSGNYELIQIPLAYVFGADGGKVNPQLYPGDVVHVLPESNGNYYIAGAVTRTGVWGLRQEMTVLQALAAAGDTKFEAKEKDCRIIRTLPNGQEKLINVNLAKVRSGEQENLILARNDLIVVPSDPFKSVLSFIGSVFTAGAQTGVNYTYDMSPTPVKDRGVE